jgi:glyoxylase-like metal-dependent hydrolase (beta-lactamase superfamily II)
MVKPGCLHQILPDLYRWRSGERGLQSPVNSYILRRDDQAVLIDPSHDLAPGILNSIGIHRVSDILITHLQNENAAGSLRFPRARLRIPDGDQYLAKGSKTYRKLITRWPPPWDWTTRGNYRGHLAGAPNERPLRRPVRVDVPLADGMLAAGCRVVSTPGHGKHAVTLLLELQGQRIAFCGDLICGQGRLWNWFDCDWDYGLQTGQRTLLISARRLRRMRCSLLCPTHGDVVRDPDASLAKLIRRLGAVLSDPDRVSPKPVNFPEKDSSARGFRQILPNLHQWRDGNCAVLISKTGSALMVDAGLCWWRPLRERVAHHHDVIRKLKRSLGIRKIEIVIPTHYHGDHTEGIPDLVAMERCRVVGLDSAAGPIETPERFRLAAMLPWYGTRHDRVRIHRKLSDGERFQWHEFEVEIFHLGGQTLYALGVAVRVQGVRVLFVGDSFALSNHCCEPVLCFNRADPATAGWPYALDRMLERRPDLLVCGHGSAVRNPMQRLRACRAAWRKRLRDFAALSARKDLRQFFDPFL